MKTLAGDPRSFGQLPNDRVFNAWPVAHIEGFKYYFELLVR